MIEWIIAAIITFFAASLASISGFGFSLIFVPALLFVYDVHTTVLLNIVLSLIISCILAWRDRKNVSKGLVKNLFLASLIGLPPGLLLFRMVDVAFLKVIVAIVSIAVSILLLAGVKWSHADKKWSEFMAGGIAGFLCGSIGIPGPPVVLLLGYKEIPKETFRAVIVTYFVLITTATLILMLISKPILANSLQLILSLLPFALVGQFLGSYLFEKVPQKGFEKGIPLLIIIMSGVTLISVLSQLYTTLILRLN